MRSHIVSFPKSLCVVFLVSASCLLACCSERTAVLHGKAVWADTGEAVTEFEVGWDPGLWSGRGLWETSISHCEYEASSSPGIPYNFLAVRDSEGRFVLENVNHGAATIFVRSKKRATVGLVEVEGISGQLVEGIRVELDPGKIVQGVVTDSGGVPIAGACIVVGRFSEGYMNIASDHSVATSRTDGQYGFSVPHVECVSAYKPGYAPGWAEVEFESGQAADVNIVLGKPCTLRGRVMIAGRPAAGELVLAHSRHCTTGPDGHFELQGLPAGEIEVHCTLRIADVWDVSRSIVQHATVKHDVIATADIVFPEPSATIHGLITLDEKPVRTGSIAVRVFNEISGEDTQWRAGVGRDGVFKTPLLPPGEATLVVSVEVPDNAVLRRVITVDAGKGQAVTRNVEMGTGTRCAIEGQVAGLRNGKTASIQVAHGHREADGRSISGLQRYVIATDFTAEDGTFRLRYLEPGRYTVVASANAVAPGEYRYAPLVASQFVNVDAHNPIATTQLTLPEDRYYRPRRIQAAGRRALE